MNATQMNTPLTAKPPLHPVLWIAAVAVTLLSLTGIAAIMGWLPARADAAMTPAAVVAVQPATNAPLAAVTPPTPEPVAAVEPAPAPVPTPPPASAVKPHKVAKKAATASTMLASNQTTSRIPPPPTAGAGVPPDYVPPPPIADAPARCADCGIVDSIREVQHEGKGSGTGAVAGGLIGGLLGNNVGHGGGRALATMAGALGGGLLGNKIEKSQHKTNAYQVSVLMDDGTTRTIDEPVMPSWHIGDQVKLVNGFIVSR